MPEYVLLCGPLGETELARLDGLAQGEGVTPEALASRLLNRKLAQIKVDGDGYAGFGPDGCRDRCF